MLVIKMQEETFTYQFVFLETIFYHTNWFIVITSDWRKLHCSKTFQQLINLFEESLHHFNPVIWIIFN